MHDAQERHLEPVHEIIEPRLVHAASETGMLRSVIIGYPDNWVMADPINKKHRIYHGDHPDRPTRERLRPEFDGLRNALEAMGIEVFQPVAVPDVPDQLTPRDIGFVLGETFVVASMATECRRDEWLGIRAIIDDIPAEHIIRAPADVVVEGGDVILDKGVLYIGLSERTNEAGAAFMQETFGDRYDVEVVSLTSAEHEDVLHLDCAFVPVGPDHALIYPPGFHAVPDAIRDQYEWIEVDQAEQHELFTNVLNVGPRCVLTRARAHRVNARLREIGIDTVELPFDYTPRCGGSFRCATLPLWRD